MPSSTMASRLIAILLGFLVLSISATARPCRTFVISYSVSIRHHSSATTLTGFKEIRSLVPLDVVRNNGIQTFFGGTLPGLLLEEVERESETELRASQRRAPFRFSSRYFSSFHQRSNDLLSLVLALLFGVSGGALIAICLYYIWSELSDRYDYVDDDEEIDSPKKTESVKIPAFESVPAQAKESV